MKMSPYRTRAVFAVGEEVGGGRQNGIENVEKKRETEKNCPPKQIHSLAESFRGISFPSIDQSLTHQFEESILFTQKETTSKNFVDQNGLLQVQWGTMTLFLSESTK